MSEARLQSKWIHPILLEQRLKDQGKDGWYKPAAMMAIRNICKVKYAYVREHGREAPNELCYNEIEKFEREIKGGKADDADEDKEEGGDDVDMDG